MSTQAGGDGSEAPRYENGLSLYDLGVLLEYRDGRKLPTGDKLKVVNRLVGLTLLRRYKADALRPPQTYVVCTERAGLYLEHLMKQPLPVATTTWVMPEPGDDDEDDE